MLKADHLNCDTFRPTKLQATSVLIQYYEVLTSLPHSDLCCPMLRLYTNCDMPWPLLVRIARQGPVLWSPRLLIFDRVEHLIHCLLHSCPRRQAIPLCVATSLHRRHPPTHAIARTTPLITARTPLHLVVCAPAPTYLRH